MEPVCARARGDDLCGLTGAFFPFARTRAEREASGDPRPSLEERYGDHEGFVEAVEEAVGRAVGRRHLLPEDGDTLIELARESAVLR